MKAMIFKDPRDSVVAQIELAFRKIPIPHTMRSGNGWFFGHDKIPLIIAKLIEYICSIDGILLVDFTLPLELVIFQALAYTARSNSDASRVAALQLELSEGSDKLLYDIIESTIKTLPQVWGGAGHYIKDESAKKKFISRIIDELFGRKNIVIISAVECFFIIQEARQYYLSLQDQASYIARIYTAKDINKK